MNIDKLKEMIDYTKEWKQWLESVPVKPEDEEGKKKLLEQMNVAIKKWSDQLGNDGNSLI